MLTRDITILPCSHPISLCSWKASRGLGLQKGLSPSGYLQPAINVDNPEDEVDMSVMKIFFLCVFHFSGGLWSYTCLS
jgi:hypothetical protein